MGKYTNDKAATRESMVFYKSFYDAIETLQTPEDRESLYRAIIEFGLFQKEPDLPGHLQGFFMLIRPQLEANLKRYQNGQKGAEHGNKGAEHGSKGGRPKNNETGQKPPKNPPNVNVNVNANDNGNGNGNDNGNGNKGAVLMKNSNVKDLESFRKAFEGSTYEKYDLKHYFDKVLNWSQSKGAKRKDWVATARNFILNDKEQGREVLNPNPPKSNKERPLPKVKDI